MTVQRNACSQLAHRRRHITAVLLLAALSPVYGADSPPVPQVELLAEVRLPVNKESSTANIYPFVFAKAVTVDQGQEIFYTLRIRNPGSQPIPHAEVVQDVPMNTRYIAGTATGAGAHIQFSVDGGKEFLDAAALPPPNRSTAGHQVTAYTHIRWQLTTPLPPKAVVLARFRAEFQ